jgi:large conductance mechanosensitive channel
MKKFYNEFKKFINKGNVMDLAVAFIIGAAFKDIINSLVKDILTPIISLLVGEEGFGNFKYVITEADEASGIVENAIYYGSFMQSVFDFFIVALVVFIIIKFVNRVSDAFEKTEDTVMDKVEDIMEDVKPKMEDILLDIKGLLSRDSKKE